MSRLSIYETRWIDLIFENRNKNYGAYQLRHESVSNSLKALFLGFLFVGSICTVAVICNNIKDKIIPIIPSTEWTEPLVVTTVNLPNEEKKPVLQEQQKIKEATIVKEQLINPTIVKPQEVTKDVAINEENSKAGGVLTAETGAPSNGGTSTGTGVQTSNTADYGNSVVNTTVLDKLPEFPGGINNFYKYVGNNFEKPDIDQTNIFKIHVAFTIEKDGSMTDIRVLKDPGYGLGTEAIRVLKSLKTKWTPGFIESKAVRTGYTLPITIQMN
jgi:periplasmic protein TonB